MYMLQTNTLHIPHLHISHICHNSLCINPLHLSAEPPDVNNNKQLCKNGVPKVCLRYMFSRLSVLRKVSHFFRSRSSFYCKKVFRSPWNQVREWGGGGYSFLSSSQLGSGFLPSGNTFEISALLWSVSWGGILTTSFSVDLFSCFLCFLCSLRLTRVPSMTGAPKAEHLMAADSPGPWFKRCMAERIWV